MFQSLRNAVGEYALLVNNVAGRPTLGILFYHTVQPFSTVLHTVHSGATVLKFSRYQLYKHSGVV